MNKEKKVLVIDDDEAVRRLLSDVLGLHEFVVCAVHNGLFALHILEKEDFDIIITDYSMPEIDGVALTKIMRSRCPKSFIIGISADCDERDFLNAGANVFLRKPFYLHDMLSMIQGGMKV
ncbi:MAG: response regulator [Nitrospirae bacterium]|nr:response regulator [Nitrospirota bacterium]